MRTVRFILLGVVMVAVVLIAVANKDPATFRLLPPAFDGVIDLSLTLPLFVILLLTLLAGVALGYLLEWGREMRQRREAAEARRTISRLEKEVEGLRRKAGEPPKNDVLALLG
jgi:uncharacterized integral membrane protein